MLKLSDSIFATFLNPKVINEYIHGLLCPFRNLRYEISLENFTDGCLAMYSPH